jgi:hypothetical protein
MWYLKPYRTDADETNFGCTPVYASDRQSPRWQIVNATTQRTTPNSAVCAFSLLVLIWFLLKPITWKDPATKLLAISILAAIIFYLIFPGTYYEYYLLGFIPLFLFIPALLINKLAGIKKYGLLTPVLVFSLLGILTALTAKNDYGLKTKELLIKNVIAVIGKNRFEEEDYGMCHIAEGWRYLFCAYGKCPERAMVDKSLGWIYPTEITQSPVDYLVTIAESRIPPNFSTKDAVAITSGGFSAYIYKQ